MKKKHLISFVSAVIVIVIFMFFKNMGTLANMSPAVTQKQNDDLSIITEPNDGIAPVIALINSASTSVDLVMYELEDKQIESALVADKDRGIAVRVLVSLGYKGESFAANQPAYDFLKANNVPVEWTQGYFALTHEKSLVIDHSRAFIMTFNFTSQYYSSSRDFGILDKDQNDVAAIDQAFENDWQGDRATADNGDDLVWSPGAEPALIGLINNAQRSLDVYNEEMADPRITKGLIDAAQRGVTVDIDMTYSSQWKKAFEELATAGAHVRTYDEDAPLYVHAKMIIADGTQAFVGSENFSESSLDDNRELGIIMSDPNMINSLNNTFAADWKGATPFSL